MDARVATGRRRRDVVAAAPAAAPPLCGVVGGWATALLWAAVQVFHSGFHHERHPLSFMMACGAGRKCIGYHGRLGAADRPVRAQRTCSSLRVLALHPRLYGLFSPGMVSHRARCSNSRRPPRLISRPIVRPKMVAAPAGGLDRPRRLRGPSAEELQAENTRNKLRSIKILCQLG